MVKNQNTMKQRYPSTKWSENFVPVLKTCNTVFRNNNIDSNI